jgi:hypothetical protein
MLETPSRFSEVNENCDNLKRPEMPDNCVEPVPLPLDQPPGKNLNIIRRL